MSKFILHGGYTRRRNESNHAFHTELVKNSPEGGTVLLVYFAAEPDHVAEVFSEHSQLLTNLSPRKNLTILLADTEGFIEQLAKAQVIYLHGGNTEKLLTSLHSFGDISSLFEGKVVAGSSAGAYALAQFGANHSGRDVREGLGLVPVRLVCHYQSPDLPPTPESVEKLEALSPELPLVFLKDCEWRIF